MSAVAASSRLRNYAQIRPFDIANGEGIRVSIFVTGCTHACPGCFNELYQDFHYGTAWDDSVTAQVIEYLDNPVVTGLTLLGGEPLQNLWLTDVVREIKRHTDKTIWVYSGYTWEQILAHRGRRELVAECDVLVDGLYVEALRDLTLKFRGSSNQRLIDVSRSLGSGEVVLYEPR
ncbi:MAG: anaerobic ribonucleoside-triphosphate reductase activating protein [Actinomycetaceae bacterium]|nr:anaerobic ribonucleoside-triphosphate reductase activating protein [Actinomycetaceae bacterium]MDU0970678.1 anaerobic ribonucleoside-triphosphate reductase activating protein [Actinomycetaceae bacterium]